MYSVELYNTSDLQHFIILKVLLLIEFKLISLQNLASVFFEYYFYAKYSQPMKTYHTSYLIILIMLLYSPLFAQDGSDQPEVKDRPFKDRIVYGGGLGLQFGTITFIEISPVVGYRLTNRLETGIGVTYKYYKYKDFYLDQTTNNRFDLKSNIYGASLYTRYHLFQNIFLHAEYEMLRYNYENVFIMGGQFIREPTHANVEGLFLGGGYRQRIASGAYFYILALWDVIEDPLSPYNNPILRMGVLLGR